MARVVPILVVILMDRISRWGGGRVLFGNLRITSLLFADVTLLASSDGDLQNALGWFVVKYQVIGMRTNTSKSVATAVKR